jgi:hypothetical protein
MALRGFSSSSFGIASSSRWRFKVRHRLFFALSLHDTKNRGQARCGGRPYMRFAYQSPRMVVVDVGSTFGETPALRSNLFVSAAQCDHWLCGKELFDWVKVWTPSVTIALTGMTGTVLRRDPGLSMLRLEECAFAPTKGCRRATVRGDGTSSFGAAVGFGDHAR